MGGSRTRATAAERSGTGPRNAPKANGGGKSKGSIATMEESWDGSDWGTYGQEPDKEHENRSMYDFIASIEHAPGTAGTEDSIGACAPEPRPRREHQGNIRGEKEYVRTCQNGYIFTSLEPGVLAQLPTLGCLNP